MIKHKKRGLFGNKKYIILSVLVLVLVVVISSYLSNAQNEPQIQGICVGAKSCGDLSESQCKSAPGCSPTYSKGTFGDYTGCIGNFVGCSAFSAVEGKCKQLGCTYVPAPDIKGICVGSKFGCGDYSNDPLNCISAGCSHLRNGEYEGVCTGAKMCSDFTQTECNNAKTFGCSWDTAKPEFNKGCIGTFVGCSAFSNIPNQCKTIGCGYYTISTTPATSFSIEGDKKISAKRITLKSSDYKGTCPGNNKCALPEWSPNSGIKDKFFTGDVSSFSEWECTCENFVGTSKVSIENYGNGEIAINPDSDIILDIKIGKEEYYLYRFSVWVKVEDTNIPLKWNADDGSSIWVYDQNEKFVTTSPVECNLLSDGSLNTANSCSDKPYGRYKRGDARYPEETFYLKFQSKGWYRLDIYLYNHEFGASLSLKLAYGKLGNYFSAIQKEKPVITQPPQQQIDIKNICNNLNLLQPLERQQRQATICNPDSEQGEDYCNALGYEHTSAINNNRCCGNKPADDCGYRKYGTTNEVLCAIENSKYSWLSSFSNRGAIKRFDCSGKARNFLSIGNYWQECDQIQEVAGNVKSVNNYDYLCTNTNSKIKDSTIGETWVKCCGNDNVCSGNDGINLNTQDFGLRTDESVEINGKKYSCASDKKFVTGLESKEGLLGGTAACRQDQCAYAQNLCVDSGTTKFHGGYIADKSGSRDNYCSNGEWSSRTKLVSSKLIRLGGDLSKDNFAVYCDRADNVIIKKGLGKKGSVNEQDLINIGAAYKDSNGNIHLRNACILKIPGQVVYGIALDSNLASAHDSFDKIFGAKCDKVTISDIDDFVACGANNIMFSPKFGILLVSNKDIIEQKAAPRSYVELGYSAKELEQTATSQKPFKKFDRVFFIKKGDVGISAVLENIDNKETFFGIYKGLDSIKGNICEYAGDKTCNKDFIISQEPKIEDKWQYLTTKLIRIEG